MKQRKLNLKLDECKDCGREVDFGDLDIQGDELVIRCACMDPTCGAYYNVTCKVKPIKIENL